jgi:hypothetical protein
MLPNVLCPNPSRSGQVENHLRQDGRLEWLWHVHIESGAQRARSVALVSKGSQSDGWDDSLLLVPQGSNPAHQRVPISFGHADIRNHHVGSVHGQKRESCDQRVGLVNLCPTNSQQISNELSRFEFVVDHQYTETVQMLA